MTPQRSFLEALVRRLDEHGIAYMIAGSIASSFHGEPRATRDVDLVIDCSREQLAALLETVRRMGWYVNAEAALTAHAERGMFNVIEPESAWKADLIIRKSREFSASEFARRTAAHIHGPGSVPLMVATPEDVILSKLEWSRDARSEQQYRDALAVAALERHRLDRDYLHRWAQALRVTDELDRLLAEVGPARPADEGEG